jgi:hypothetical protein
MSLISRAFPLVVHSKTKAFIERARTPQELNAYLGAVNPPFHSGDNVSSVEIILHGEQLGLTGLVRISCLNTMSANPWQEQDS